MKKLMFSLTLIFALTFSNVMFASTNSGNLKIDSKTEITKPKTVSLWVLPVCYYHTTKKVVVSPDGTITVTTSSDLVCVLIVIP